MSIGKSAFAPGHLFIGLLVAALLLLPAGPPAGESEEATAAGYYRMLAEGGVGDAQLVLGDLYRHGDGVAVNLVEAFAWYYLAAQQGVEEALRPMNEVLRALSEAEAEKARKLAEEYEKRFLPGAQ